MPHKLRNSKTAGSWPVEDTPLCYIILYTTKVSTQFSIFFSIIGLQGFSPYGRTRFWTQNFGFRVYGRGQRGWRASETSKRNLFSGPAAVSLLGGCNSAAEPKHAASVPKRRISSYSRPGPQVTCCTNPIQCM